MRLQVRVKPNQRDDRIWRDGDGLVAHIRAVPKDGEANVYLINFLAEQFGVAKSLISIVRGHTSNYKSIVIQTPEAQLTEQLGKFDQLPQISLFD